MNVKPGDIARIVAGDFLRNINKLVTVQRAASSDERAWANDDWVCVALQPLKSWDFSLLRTCWLPAGGLLLAQDRDLRPLYDGDAPDEMVRKVGKPKPITEKLRGLGLPANWP